MEDAVIAYRTGGLRAERFTRMGTHTVFREMNDDIFGAMTHDIKLRSLVGIDEAAASGR
ncbi:hypothetical protein GKA01_04370 [Gluconobacter kanchanaburiensis NBRC 103587]|uniref:Uncharacterized protein n=1 Tax=Gluconobacter kanchanaburiensis NBRC 103587 TaxID=1307948 RepID=A0A511B471_9PROT|nr:hypothetical protein AA103587_0089 [Gluconobacter kanchanaburiensis NBRC 103587]GEK95240.1 hypothetical protein GKA01_04370 [Gluconobacter kanchanaburiensis NBRC 103587]